MPRTNPNSKEIEESIPMVHGGNLGMEIGANDSRYLEIYVDCYLNDTVEDLKHRIEKMTGISYRDQAKLLLDGQLMEDSKVLGSCNIAWNDNDEISIVPLDFISKDSCCADRIEIDQVVIIKEGKYIQLYFPEYNYSQVGSIPFMKMEDIDKSYEKRHLWIEEIDIHPASKSLLNSNMKPIKIIAPHNPTVSLVTNSLRRRNKSHLSSKNCNSYQENELIQVNILIQSVGQNIHLDISRYCTLRDLVYIVLNEESRLMKA